MSERQRLGRIHLAHLNLLDHMDDMFEMFARLAFIPIRAESMYDKATIEMVGYSPWFDMVETHIEAPLYEVWFDKYWETIEVERVGKVKKGVSNG